TLFTCISLFRACAPRSPHFPYTPLFRSRMIGPVLTPSPTAVVAVAVPVISGAAGVRRTLARGGSNHPPPAQVAAAHAATLVNDRSEEHTSELQSLRQLVCRLLLEKKKQS